MSFIGGKESIPVKDQKELYKELGIKSASDRVKEEESKPKFDKEKLKTIAKEIGIEARERFKRGATKVGQRLKAGSRQAMAELKAKGKEAYEQWREEQREEKESARALAEEMKTYRKQQRGEHRRNLMMNTIQQQERTRAERYVEKAQKPRLTIGLGSASTMRPTRLGIPRLNAPLFTGRKTTMFQTPRLKVGMFGGSSKSKLTIGTPKLKIKGLRIR